MSLDPMVLLAILVMAAMNYLMRAAGFWVMAHVPLTRRKQRMLEALPGSIVAASLLIRVAPSPGQSRHLSNCARPASSGRMRG